MPNRAPATRPPAATDTKNTGRPRVTLMSGDPNGLAALLEVAFARLPRIVVDHLCGVS
jgi:hypothetical protein